MILSAIVLAVTLSYKLLGFVLCVYVCFLVGFFFWGGGGGRGEGSVNSALILHSVTCWV